MRLPDEYRQALHGILNNLETAANGIDELKEQTFEGSAADGDVTATVTASSSLTEIQISRTAVRNLDNLTLGDAVAEAVNHAESQAQEAKDKLLASLTVNGVPISELIADPGKAISVPEAFGR